MRKTIFLFFILTFCFSGLETFAHKRAKYNIVIDTDGGVDDLRAMTYFMASREFNINAITTVDGVLPPKLAADYISELCKLFNHEGIRIGQGNKSGASKQYYEHALPIWKNLIPDVKQIKHQTAEKLFANAIEFENKRTIVIAMGPLTTIAAVLKQNPNLCPKVETILWYADYDTTPKGYNYEQDTEAYETLKKLKVPIKLVYAKGEKYKKDFLEVCSEIENVYTTALIKAFKNSEFQNTEIYYWDDFLPLYLLFPSMFNELVIEEYARRIVPKSGNFFDILVTGVLNFDKPDQGVSFNEIPTSGYMLRQDIEKVADSILLSHGYAEFKIVALTNEIHSHIGVYSILGAKTGLRIMEYLHAGLDEIDLISYAGYTPPLSCFNDGLQVGTGSTIGYGTITVDDSEDKKPAVLVKYNGREILFSLKQQVVDEVVKDISSLVKKYGLESEMYWSELREISIKKYWLGMSRFDILDIEEKDL
ncbi:MAG: nucleoside hydrolase [Bacteroidales bacterium]|nr:nucleoside hydrolase [Bacteroidales bacterium]